MTTEVTGLVNLCINFRGTLERVHRVHELLLRSHEDFVLLLADVRRFRQLRLSVPRYVTAADQQCANSTNFVIELIRFLTFEYVFLREYWSLSFFCTRVYPVQAKRQRGYLARRDLAGELVDGGRKRQDGCFGVLNGGFQVTSPYVDAQPAVMLSDFGCIGSPIMRN